jgi:heat shock protein HslJ
MKSIRMLAPCLLVVLGACASPSRTGAAPSYVPANAAPPEISVASNELVGRTWQWQRSELPGGRTVTAAAPERYTLAFQPGGRVLLRADCNRGSGSYEVNGGAMKMGPAATTKMGCPPDSQDGEFLRQLAQVAGYGVNGDELALALREGGTMRLRAAPK